MKSDNLHPVARFLFVLLINLIIPGLGNVILVPNAKVSTWILFVICFFAWTGHNGFVTFLWTLLMGVKAYVNIFPRPDKFASTLDKYYPQANTPINRSYDQNDDDSESRASSNFAAKLRELEKRDFDAELAERRKKKVYSYDGRDITDEQFTTNVNADKATGSNRKIQTRNDEALSISKDEEQKPSPAGPPRATDLKASDLSLAQPIRTKKQNFNSPPKQKTAGSRLLVAEKPDEDSSNDNWFARQMRNDASQSKVLSNPQEPGTLEHSRESISDSLTGSQSDSLTGSLTDSLTGSLTGNVSNLSKASSTLTSSLNSASSTLTSAFNSDSRNITEDLNSESSHLTSDLNSESSILTNAFKSGSSSKTDGLNTESSHISSDLNSASSHLTSDLSNESRHLTSDLNYESSQLTSNLNKEGSGLTNAFKSDSSKITEDLNSDSSKLTDSLNSASSILSNSLNSASSLLSGDLSTSSLLSTDLSRLTNSLASSNRPSNTQSDFGAEFYSSNSTFSKKLDSTEDIFAAFGVPLDSNSSVKAAQCPACGAEREIGKTSCSSCNAVYS